MIFSLSWNIMFTDYCKALVLNFSEMENTVFVWAKKLMEIWYLLTTEKFLFWTFCWWVTRSFFSQKLMDRWYLLGIFELSIIAQDLWNMVFRAVGLDVSRAVEDPSFKSAPTKTTAAAKPLIRGRDRRILIGMEVKEMLEKWNNPQVCHQSRKFLSRIFLVGKIGSGEGREDRAVINAKFLTKSLPYQHLKM